MSCPILHQGICKRHSDKWNASYLRLLIDGHFDPFAMFPLKVCILYLSHSSADLVTRIQSCFLLYLLPSMAAPLALIDTSRPHNQARRLTTPVLLNATTNRSQRPLSKRSVFILLASRRKNDRSSYTDPHTLSIILNKNLKASRKKQLKLEMWRIELQTFSTQSNAKQTRYHCATSPEESEILPRRVFYIPISGSASPVLR